VKCPSCQAECPEKAEACFTCGKALFAVVQGTVLAGRYQIESALGKGGMSRVYLASDRILHEPVAIKVLRAELAWEPEMRQRFLHEIRLARRVSHPNVCRIHEYGEEGPLRYLSMELVEGVNLQDVLRGRGLATDEVFDITLQLVSGLTAVHHFGIIHRDLKASNVMINQSGVAKLMDFGIAKQAERETIGFTAPGQVLGTPEYMSPEHARGGKVDFRSDIYALGCLLFEMLTGQAPFRGANAFATISKHFNEPVPLEGALATLIPEALQPVLRRMLAKSPDDRYPSTSALNEALLEAQLATLGPPAKGAERPLLGSARLQALCEQLIARGPSPAMQAANDSLVQAGGGSPPDDGAGALDRLTSSIRRRTPLWVAGTVATVAVLGVAWGALSRPNSGEAGAVPAASPAAVALAPSATPSNAPAPTPTAPPATPSPEPTESPLRTVAAAGPRVAPRSGASARPAPPASTGTLRLVVVPFAEVEVDGTALGRISSRDIPLAPGEHRVRLLHPDYLPLQRKVTVQAGGVAPLVVELAEKGIRKAP
jgi:eukaryotic-like serine/threonine-protein kinase